MPGRERHGRFQLIVFELIGVLSACVVWAAWQANAKASDAKQDFTFVQISDTHIGFSNLPNRNPGETLREAISRINAMPVPPDFVIHSGDLSNLSKAEEFDSLDVMLGQIHAGKIYFVPGEHDVIPDNGKLFFSRYAPNAQPGGWYSFDHKGVHFVALVNVINRAQTGFGHLGKEQLDWLGGDLRKLPAGTPIVVFTHIPLWTVYAPWGWGTDDAEPALADLKRFEHVTILNGHIHQIQHAVIGSATLQTARSTAFPQPPPDPANHPGPFTTVPADQLRSYLGIREISYAANTKTMTIMDTPLAAAPVPIAMTARDTLIEIRDFKFIPDMMAIAVGTVVRWVNHDSEAHTVMSSNKSFTQEPQPLDMNDTFTYTFTKPGTYDYYCSVHPNMKGRIVVQ